MNQYSFESWNIQQTHRSSRISFDPKHFRYTYEVLPFFWTVFDVVMTPLMIFSFLRSRISVSDSISTTTGPFASKFSDWVINCEYFNMSLIMLLIIWIFQLTSARGVSGETLPNFKRRNCYFGLDLYLYKTNCQQIFRLGNHC